MEHLAALHARLQVTWMLVLLGLALWGVITFLRGASVGQYYRALMSIATLLVLAEAAIGLPLLFSSNRIGSLALHLIYGAVAVAVLPALMLYNRERSGRWEALTYAGGAVFLIGIAMRAYETGL